MVMAQDRTNMVSYLDIGLLLGSSSKIVELGDGFTEITEDWAPETEQTQYVNMKNKANSVKGYALSISPEREYLSDDVQECIDTMFKKFPTGKACETFYYRYYKTDLSGTDTLTGDCIKVPVTVCPASTGGAGGDILKSTININGNGDVIEGTATIDSDGTFSFA